MPRRKPDPPPRERLLGDERRTQLLALGLGLFSARPYDEVSIDEIARAARVSKGLLYHYFPTKRDLYVAALRMAAGQLLADTLTDGDLAPEAQLRQGLEAYLAFAERHAPAYQALLRGGIGSDPEVAAILDQTRTALLARILDALPARITRPVVRVALRGWIGFVEAATLEWLARRAIGRAELVTLFVTTLLDLATRVAASG